MVAFGPGWAPLELRGDKDFDVVRVSQDDRDIIIPKAHLRSVIDALEALAKETS